jgi:hypothetical protein
METAILILQDSLNEQKQQLSLAEKRQNDYKNEKQKLMKMKAVNNLKGFIADIENAIKTLECAQEERYASVPQANELLPHVSGSLLPLDVHKKARELSAGEFIDWWFAEKQ